MGTGDIRRSASAQMIAYMRARYIIFARVKRTYFIGYVRASELILFRTGVLFVGIWNGLCMRKGRCACTWTVNMRPMGDMRGYMARRTRAQCTVCESTCIGVGACDG